MAQKGKQANQNQDGLSKELEEQKKQLMQSESTLKSMKNRLDRMEAERNKYYSEYFELKKKLELENKELRDQQEFDQKQIAQLDADKKRAEFEQNIMRMKMEDVEKVQRDLQELKAKEFDIERQTLMDRIKFLEARLEKIDSFLSVKADLENEKRVLLENLEKERKDKTKELADKDREKVQATDMLKKDMLHKIQVTKQDLLALKKEQLETTTRLTVLQNHQLTTELEYQSKQTEKLLFKNSKLQEQVTSLKRDIEIHKQVEQELAKRSHFSQKLIKKLSARIKELEDIQENQQQQQEQNQQQSETQNVEEKFKDFEAQSLQLQRKVAKLQNDNDILRNENNHLLTKLDAHKIEEQKYGNLASLIAANLEALKNSDDLKQIDLQELREKQVEEWTPNEKQTILQILLTQAQQFLTKRYLNVTDEKINITLIDNNNKSVAFPSIMKIQEEETASNQPSKRFQGVPLDISAQIVKSNLRDWGKPAQSQPQNQLTRKYKMK
ncbi:hypothetical protein pb186bvf_018487 [Paramecium bursaria]